MPKDQPTMRSRRRLDRRARTHIQKSNNLNGSPSDGVTTPLGTQLLRHNAEIRANGSSLPFHTYFIHYGGYKHKSWIIGGWYWDRTSGPCCVRAVLYR